jgi:uncharacterized membrane protein YdjX (TVP38/TMEM64 family)
MENVFGYFVAIGSGLSVGLTLGSIPAFLVWRKIRSKEVGGRNAYQTQKARS